MKVVILYRPESEHGRKVEEFVHDVEHQHGKLIETVDIDSRPGIAMAELYGIMNPPAVLALKDDGALSQMWQADEWPLMNEILYYLQDVELPRAKT